MKNPLKMLACDIGAGSGRVIMGMFDGEKLSCTEIHRFPNDYVRAGGHFYWDILRLFYEVKQGILKCANAGHRDIASMAMDTWGVDICLLDEMGNLLSNPYHYRDSLTDGMMEEVFKIIPKEELYMLTGLQFMKFNSVFQLYAMKQRGIPALKLAKTMLMVPDLLNYFLCGVKASEYSVASTTQLLDAHSKAWSEEVIGRLGLPGNIFPEIVRPGTVLGGLLPDIAVECGTKAIPVIAAASHDTAAAVAAIPAAEGPFAYISCGTWSLMGVESDRPVINKKSYTLSYSNEGGVCGRIRFLKMIMGLWLMQECRKQWALEGKSYGFSELESMAMEAEPFQCFIDPDHASLMAPGDMPGRIAEYCRKTCQPLPETTGAIVRCIVQSLALKYRQTVENLEDILCKALPVIHMVGGGIKDRLLCGFTADATGRNVIAGPVEASSAGSLMVQTMALGELDSLREIRQVIRGSFPIETYEPRDTGLWDEAYERYKKITGTAGYKITL